MRRWGMAGDARRRAVETATVTLVVTAVMAAVFGSHVADGGLYSDDWALAASERTRGYLGSVSDTREVYGSRPLLAALATLPYHLFGVDPGPLLVMALALGVVTALAFYAVLRALRLSAMEAGPIAALLVVFPWSDSTRLWISGSLLQAALILYLLGVLVALHGLRASGRAGMAWHAGAAGLYAASVLAYEAGAALALITGVLYLRHVERRAAFARWGLDVAAVGAAALYSALETTKGTEPLGEQLANAADMALGAVELAANALLPVGAPAEIVAPAALAVVLGAAAVAARRPDPELRRWLAVVTAAAIATAAGYATFVPAAYWTPQHPALENRVNLVAALGLVTLVYAVIRLAVRLALHSSTDRRQIGASLVLAAAVGAGYVARIEDDKARWAQAYAEEREVLSAVRRAMPAPPPQTTIFAFGHRPQVAARLPVFYDNFDLLGGVRLMYQDASLSAYPVFRGARFACGGATLTVSDMPSPNPAQYIDVWSYGDGSKPYGRAWFADVRTGRAIAVVDRASCRRAVRQVSDL